MLTYIPVNFFSIKNFPKKYYSYSLKILNFNVKMVKITPYKNSWDLKNPKSKKLNRFNLDESISDALINFQKSYVQTQFFEVCYLNRDFLSFSLLYRLTAIKLRSETDLKKTKQTRGIEDFRKKILKNILLIDQTITQGLIYAEKRIKQILSIKLLQEDDILKLIGDDQTSIACFWVVLQAALSAWEKKENEKENEKKNIYDTYEKLKKIDETLFKSKKHQEMLAFEFKYVDFLQKKKKNERELERCESDYLEGLKIIISQLERLPSNSYGLFLKKLLKISNQILEKKFSSKIENFNNVNIKLPLSDVGNNSRLIEIQTNEIS